MPAIRPRRPLPGLPPARHGASGAAGRRGPRPPGAPGDLAAHGRARRHRGVAARRGRGAADPRHHRPGREPVPHGRQLRGLRLRGPDQRRRPPGRGLRVEGAAGALARPHARGALRRHHGADRAPGRLQPRRRPGPRDPLGRPLPALRLQDLHLRRRPGPDRERRAHGAGAHRRRAPGDEGRVPLPRPEAPPRGRWRARAERRPRPRAHPQDRLAGAPQRHPGARARPATAAAGSWASPAAGSPTCSR